MARFKFNSAASVFKLTATNGLQPTGKPVKKQHVMSARRSAPGVGGFKIRRRAKSGVKALLEIQRMQKTVELIIPKLRFQNLCRELGWDKKIDLMWSRDSFIALQHAAEDFLVLFLEVAYESALHSGSETLRLKDIQFTRHLFPKIRGN